MIVNFAVKQQGLEAQLLNTVVKQERADLDRQKNELVVKVAQGKRTQVGSFVPCLQLHDSYIASRKEVVHLLPHPQCCLCHQTCCLQAVISNDKAAFQKVRCLGDAAVAMCCSTQCFRGGHKIGDERF